MTVDTTLTAVTTVTVKTLDSDYRDRSDNRDYMHL